MFDPPKCILFATKVTEEDMTFVPTGKFEAANGDADTWGPARLSHNNDQWKQENLEKSFTFQVF